MRTWSCVCECPGQCRKGGQGWLKGRKRAGARKERWLEGDRKKLYEFESTTVDMTSLTVVWHDAEDIPNASLPQSTTQKRGNCKHSHEML